MASSTLPRTRVIITPEKCDIQMTKQQLLKAGGNFPTSTPPAVWAAANARHAPTPRYRTPSRLGRTVTASHAGAQLFELYYGNHSYTPPPAKSAAVGMG
jgi:hypothetical protein